MPDQEVTIAIKARDEATGVLSKVGGAFSKFQANIVTLNQGLNLVKQGARLLKAGFESIIEPSITAGRIMAQVKNNVENAGQAWTDIQPKLRAYSQQMIEMGFDDEQTASSVSRLMLITKDYSQALWLNQLAMDLARNKNISLEEATTAVARVTQGNTRALMDYGITAKNTSSVTDILSEAHKKFGGSAKAALDTTAVGLEAVKIKWENVRQEIGDRVAPILNAVLAAASKAMTGASKSTGGFKSAIEGLVSPLTSVLTVLGQVDKAVGNAVGHKNQGLIRQFIAQMGESLGMVGRIVGTGLSALGEGAKQFTYVTGTALRGEWDQIGKQVAWQSKNMSMAVQDVTTEIGNIPPVIPPGGADPAIDAAKDIVDAYEKVRNEIAKVADDIISINQRVEDLNVSHAKDTLDFKQKLATAFVDQEQKVADLRSEIATTTDADQRNKLQDQLKREETALNQRRTIEMAFSHEVAEARRVAAETEFERQVENITNTQTLAEIEFQGKLSQYARELEAKQKQRDQLLVLETEISAKAVAASKSRTQSMVDHIDSLIKKYNDLASAAARAYSITAPTAGPMSFAPAVKRAAGGMIPGPYLGAPVPALLHAGEQIVPIGAAQNRGGAGVIITINNPFFLDRSSMQKIMAQMMGMVREQVRV